MICRNCRKAGDESKAGNKSISEVLHSKCEYPDCYCQHKVK